MNRKMSSIDRYHEKRHDVVAQEMFGMDMRALNDRDQDLVIDKMTEMHKELDLAGPVDEQSMTVYLIEEKRGPSWEICRIYQHKSCAEKMLRKYEKHMPNHKFQIKPNSVIREKPEGIETWFDRYE